MTPPVLNDRSNFEIAVICVLGLEVDTANGVFGTFCEELREKGGQATGDNHAYCASVIGEHNSLLAYTPGMGKVNAAARGRQLAL